MISEEGIDFTKLMMIGILIYNIVFEAELKDILILIYIYIYLNALFRVSLLENLERILVNKIIWDKIGFNSSTVIIFITIRATPEIHFKSK